MQKRSRALVVVDMQVDFVSGALGFEQAKPLPEKIASLIKENIGLADLYFTLDTHEGDYLFTEEGKRLPIPHCIKGSAGHRLCEELEPFAKEGTLIEKPGFGSLELALALKENGYSEVAFCGIDSSICVFCSAILAKAALPNARICVLREYSLSSDLEAQERAYAALKRVHIDVI